MKKKIFYSILIVYLLAFFYGVHYFYRASSAKKIAIVKDYKPWSAELLATVGSTPIHDNNRLQPFASWARFQLYGLHGKRNIKITLPNGKKYRISPTAWMLDCMFRPKLANRLPLFDIKDNHLMTLIGVKAHTNRRSYYSFNELIVQGDAKQRSRYFHQVESKQKKQLTLTHLEKQTLALMQRINTYYLYIQQTRTARFASLFLPQNSSISRADKIVIFANNVAKFRHNIAQKTQQGKQLRLLAKKELQEKLPLWQGFPLRDKKSNTLQWINGNDWLSKYLLAGAKLNIPQLEVMYQWADCLHKVQLAEKQANKKALSQAIIALFKTITDRHKQWQGEDNLLRNIEQELKFYQKNYFVKALVYLFIALTIFLIISPLLATKFGSIGYFLVMCLAAWSCILLWIGIFHRADILQRWPLGNLYDTILFIAALVLTLPLLIELITRKRIALIVGVIIAILMLILAQVFEISESGNHMKPLPAVLVSDYWLKIHVTTIILGYSGGLLAAAMSHYYLLVTWFNIYAKGSPERRRITQIVYGLVCYTLLFSLLGTILGGIWANDSWGRFWGWDPKENGALMIVLWYLIILHARVAGYIKEFGLHMCCIFGAIVVGFSWWGVNFFGVGLHNYGFTSVSGKQALYLFYGLESLIILVAICIYYYKRTKQK